MRFKKEIEYEAAFLPPRCRKQRFRTVNETVSFRLRSISGVQAPIACIVHDGDKEPVVYRYYKKTFWRPMLCLDVHDRKQKQLPTHRLPAYIRTPHGQSREEIIQDMRKQLRRYRLIDGVVHEKTGEPRYVVMTFGGDLDAGSTTLFVDTFCNENIHERCYYNANEHEKALAYANKLALELGHSSSLTDFTRRRIVVLMPDVFKYRRTCDSPGDLADADPYVQKLATLDHARCPKLSILQRFLTTMDADDPLIVRLHTFYEQRIGINPVWRYPFCDGRDLGGVILPVREGFAMLTYNTMNSEDREIYDPENMYLIDPGSAELFANDLATYAATLGSVFRVIRERGAKAHE